MPLDLAECRIQTPTGPDRVNLYRMLGEIFPADRDLFAWLITSGQPLHTWTPYTLFLGDKILGNVSLMPLRIWLGRRPVDVVGIASVATDSEHRRQGVAGRLLRHCLAMVDRERLPAVLFTGQPAVYSGLGFTGIPQTYLECPLHDWPLPAGGLQRAWLDRPTHEDWETLAAAYRDSVPNYDGKLVRDRPYWALYRTLFGFNPRWRLVACREDGPWLGYARCEEEPGRLLVSEFICLSGREDVAAALLGAVFEKARRLGREFLSLAMPPGHFLHDLLRSRGVPLAVEGPDAVREAFMVRPAAGQPLGPLAQLQWSLADKF
jgi:GNAT superfamily N-acetyltransferase